MSGVGFKEIAATERAGCIVPGLFHPGTAGRPAFVWLDCGVVSALPEDSPESDLPEMWFIYAKPRQRE